MINNLELSKCLEMLSKNYIGRLAYISGKKPYLVPITYFHDADEESIIGYAPEGHKIQAMREYEWVTLLVDDIESIQNWRSVQVQGRFEELTGSTAKKYLHRFAEGVQDTIKQSKGGHPKFIQDFSARLQNENIPLVYRIAITGIIGKIKNEKK